MKKTVLNLGESLTATKQKEINGGAFVTGSCEDIYHGNSRQICGIPHCPGTCDGNGGYIIY